MSIRDFHAPKQHRMQPRRYSWEEAKLHEANGWLCHYCAERTDYLTVDHKVPRINGGTDDPSNLLSACKTCNSAKRDKSYDEYREWLNIEVISFEHTYMEGYSGDENV